MKDSAGSVLQDFVEIALSVHNVQNLDSIGSQTVDYDVLALRNASVALSNLITLSAGIRQRPQVKTSLFQAPNKSDRRIQVILRYVLKDFPKVLPRLRRKYDFQSLVFLR